MKLKLNIQQRIQLFVTLSVALIFGLGLAYIGNMAINTARRNAIELTQETLQKYSLDIEKQMGNDMANVKTLSQAVTIYKTFPGESWKPVVQGMYKAVLNANDNVLSVWDSWQLNMIDSSYTKTYGRYVYEVFRQGSEIKSNEMFKSMDGDPPLYVFNRSEGEKGFETINVPYFYTYTGRQEDNILMTSLVSPILTKGKFIGVVGFDISLERFQNLVRTIQPFEGSYAVLISTDLKYVGHPDDNKLGEEIAEDFPNDYIMQGMDVKIQNGEKFSFFGEGVDGKDYYFAFNPVWIGKARTPWMLGIAVPTSTMLADARSTTWALIFVGLLGLAAMSLIVWWISRKITANVLGVTILLGKLSKGHLDESMSVHVDTTDEIGVMSEALNISVTGLIAKAEFAKKIGTGQLNTELELLSDEDELGKALVEMQRSLLAAKEAESKRLIEEEQRSWTNEGLAKFGDILRQNNDNLNNLANSILSNLIHYMGANQGGVFIYNDDEKGSEYYQMVAAYAYDRKKFLKKDIMVGEGLVGTSVLEKKTIYMTNVPEHYIQISSGTGEARPRCLLIVPLLVEENVLGVIEMASFNVFEPYQIQFVEKVGESIATTLQSVRINLRTQSLLNRSQQQAEELAAQEEEMRQNMEELQATQEESARKGAEMQSYIEALNTSTYVIEYDTEGYIIYINDLYLNLLGLVREEVVGSHHSDKMQLSAVQQREYDQFWQDLRSGKQRRETNSIKVDGASFTFEETYTPIRDESGMIYKILKIANNLTTKGNK
jgi:methyl-accepting chemotaxis protein